MYTAQIEQLLAGSAIITGNGARRVPFVMGSSFRSYLHEERVQTEERDIIDSWKESRADQFGQSGGLDSTAFDQALTDTLAKLVGPKGRLSALGLADSIFYTPVQMLINPTDLGYTQGKRKVGIPTDAGTRWLHFLDAQNKNNDILRISISGTTGAIVPEADAPAKSPESLECNRRYQTWLSFYKLCGEPMLWTNNEGQLVPNEFSVVCPSPHLRVPVAFIGHWDAMPEVKVNAENRRSLSYTATFVVDRITPDLDTTLSIALDNAPLN